MKVQLSEVKSREISGGRQGLKLSNLESATIAIIATLATVSDRTTPIGRTATLLIIPPQIGVKGSSGQSLLPLIIAAALACIYAHGVRFGCYTRALRHLFVSLHSTTQSYHSQTAWSNASEFLHQYNWKIISAITANTTCYWSTKIRRVDPPTLPFLVEGSQQVLSTIHSWFMKPTELVFMTQASTLQRRFLIPETQTKCD